MKPFNLEEAKQGKPVITRDGRDARIICFDRNHLYYPIVALVKENKCDDVYSYTLEGHYHAFHKGMDGYNLMMKSEKKKGWINIYKDGCFTIKYNSSPIVYDTKQEAQMAAALCKDYHIATIEIEWEE